MTRAARRAWLAGALILAGVGTGCDARNEARDREPLPPLHTGLSFDDVEGSRLRFERVAARAERRGDAVYAAEARTQVARCAGLQGRAEEARAILDAVERGPGVDHPRVRLRLLLERGRLANLAGRPEQAFPLFVRAFELGVQGGEAYLAADAAHMAANASPPARAEAWNLRGIEHVERAGDAETRGWLAVLRRNLGWSRYTQGRHEAALREFERAEQLYAELGDHRPDELLCRSAQATALRALGRTAEAVARAEAARAELEILGWNAGVVLEELAEGYAALGRADDSRVAARAALAALRDDPRLASDPPRRARLRALAGG
jgi:tetratricopeptide (TPR) repeat protein